MTGKGFTVGSPVTGKLADDKPFIVFDLTASGSATEGAHSLELGAQGEIAIMTGAVVVDSQARPRAAGGAEWSEYR